MSKCCDPDAPKILTLSIGGELVGLIGVEQAFLDLRSLELADGEVTEKLFEIVARRNYIVEGTEREYKIALFAAYKSYIAKSRL